VGRQKTRAENPLLLQFSTASPAALPTMTEHLEAHGVPIRMGHGELATTFEIYGEGASDRAKQAVAARLDDLDHDPE
jgi:hypothetical protein